MKKTNCWEFNKCGREPGGARIKSLGVCATATNSTVNGLNGGINGGRLCWLISGTYGKSKAEYANCIAMQNLTSCIECEFHNQVLREEGFTYTDTKIRKTIERGTSQSPF